MQRQLDERDGKTAPDPTPISVLSLFRAATEQVNQAFDGEQLVPTEHAQLDDNGDGMGTEIADLSPESNDQTIDQLDKQTDASLSLLDGVRASRVLIKRRPISKSKATTPASIDLPSPPAQPNP